MTSSGKYSLQALRVNAKLSIEDASKKLGITPKTLSFYENGKSVPRLNIVLKMCKLYGCGVEHIDTKIYN